MIGKEERKLNRARFLQHGSDTRHCSFWSTSGLSAGSVVCEVCSPVLTCCLRIPEEVPGNTAVCLKFCCSTLHFRYGFGEAGKPKFGIEPNAELIYEVTLKSFEKVRKYQLLRSHGGCFLHALSRSYFSCQVVWMEMAFIRMRCFS